MGTSSDIRISEELGRAALKLAIKATLREIVAEAMQRPIQPLAGTTADTDTVYELWTRLALLDKLVNAPSCEPVANALSAPTE